MVRKIKDRVRARYHLALSEVGAQNTWQRVVLGFALVGTERDRVETRVGDVVTFIEDMGLASLAGDEREVLRYGEADLGGAGLDPEGPDADWIPESWKDAGRGEPEAG